jgi:hypothetical protein
MKWAMLVPSDRYPAETFKALYLPRRGESSDYHQPLSAFTEDQEHQPIEYPRTFSTIWNAFLAQSDMGVRIGSGGLRMYNKPRRSYSAITISRASCRPP